MTALLDSIAHEGARLGAAAHTCGFARHVRGVLAGAVSQQEPLLPFDPHRWDEELAGLVDDLRAVPPDAPVENWSVAPPTAALWVRRAAHELAVHRWDAEPGPPPAVQWPPGRRRSWGSPPRTCC